jgi:alkylated DNA repair dioxygenase AlkB
MSHGVATIPGLHYQAAYLTAAEQHQLLTAIDQQPWLTDLKRRVQHYGYRYDYTRRTVDAAGYLGPLPAWSAPLRQRLLIDGWATHPLDQLIVNEYLPGQGIASHIDCVPCFGATILAISLGGACVMTFTRVSDGSQVSLLLEPGSLLVLTGAARYAWKHGIPARKTDMYQGQVLPRRRRISVTLRTIITPDM